MGLVAIQVFLASADIQVSQAIQALAADLVTVDTQAYLASVDIAVSLDTAE